MNNKSYKLFDGAFQIDWRMLLCYFCCQFAAFGGVQYPSPPRPTLPHVKLPKMSMINPPRTSIHILSDYGRGNYELMLVEEDIVGNRVNVDSWGRKWTAELLTVDAGYRTPWSPELTYALFPHGIHNEKNKMVAFVNRILILFEKIDKQQSKREIQSISHPNYFVVRKDKYLVLVNRAVRRWYFESPDYGQSFRLAKIELIKHPGRFTELKYKGKKITSIVYPDRKQTLLKYKNGLVSMITMPSGEITKTKRDDNGFILFLETVRLVQKPSRIKDELIIRRQFYENDARGRIRKFINNCGLEYKIEYGHAKLYNREINTIIIRNLVDNSFRFQRHTKDSGSEWIIERGSGVAGQSIREAKIQTRDVLRKINYTFRTVESYKPPGNLGIYKKYNVRGNITGKTDNAGRYTELKYDRKNQWYKTIYPDGSSIRKNKPMRLKSTRNGLWKREEILANGVTKIYYYNVFRDIVKIEQNGKSDHFKYDRLAQLREHKKADGTFVAWQRNVYGQLKSKTVTLLNGEKLITHYIYNQQGRLSKILYPDKTFVIYEYECDKLVAYARRDGKIIRYRYDSKGRLRYRGNSKESQERFKYDDRNRVAHYGVKKNGTWKIVKLAYSALDQLTEETLDKKTTKYFYDKVGRRYGIIYPNKDGMILSFDSRDRVIAIRGKHQPAKIIVYKNDRIEKEIQIPSDLSIPPIISQYQYDKNGHRHKLEQKALY